MKYYGSNNSDLAVANMVSASAIIGTIFFILWGVISDNLRTKLGRRLPLILVGCFGTAVFLCLVVLTQVEVFVFLLVGVLIAITSNCLHMSNKVLVPDLIPKEKRGRVNLFVNIGAQLASIPIWIASIILLPDGDHFSKETHDMFILIGAAVLVVTGITLFFLIKEPKIDTPPHKVIDDFKSLVDFNVLKQNKGFFMLFLATLFIIMSQNAYLPYLLIMMQDIEFEITDLIIAIPIVGGAVGIAIVIATKYIDKVGRKKIVIPSLIIAPIGGIILTFMGETKWGLIIGFAIMMPFSTIIQFGVDTWTQDMLPADARGKYIGILRIGNAIGKSIGVSFAGLMAFVFGDILWIFFTAGIILWISIPVFLMVPETLFRKDRTERGEILPDVKSE
jgi:MFS family permease